MEQGEERDPAEKTEDDEETQETAQEPEGKRSSWRSALGLARRGAQRYSEMINDTAGATRQGIQRSGEVVADATVDATNLAVRGIRNSGETIADATPIATSATRRGLQRTGEVVADATTDAASATKRGAIRTGEVLTGADIRRFDEFTEAVTRVAVGLHHDQADVKERVARLEQEAAEIRRFQAELAGRIESIERMLTPQHDEGSKE